MECVYVCVRVYEVGLQENKGASCSLCLEVIPQFCP